eukprot:TRINITY_DN9383_c0_g1_i1.p1 TRINITY_DN9383_c0_g1~~TRINITY_DN9383_c0_g1_i1.p1  ORF type:complete len:703 (+),score=123.99 TRINITY_DN9383_c0_g1_i1:349-2457(+)
MSDSFQENSQNKRSTAKSTSQINNSAFRSRVRRNLSEITSSTSDTKFSNHTEQISGGTETHPNEPNVPNTVISNVSKSNDNKHEYSNPNRVTQSTARHSNTPTTISESNQQNTVQNSINVSGHTTQVPSSPFPKRQVRRVPRHISSPVIQGGFGNSTSSSVYRRSQNMNQSEEELKRLAEERQKRREELKRLREERKNREELEAKRRAEEIKDPSNPEKRKATSPGLIKRTKSMIFKFSKDDNSSTKQKKFPKNTHKTESLKKSKKTINFDVWRNDKYKTAFKQKNEVLEFFKKHDWSKFGKKLSDLGFEKLEDLSDDDLDDAGMNKNQIRKCRRLILDHTSKENSEDEEPMIISEWCLLEYAPGEISVEGIPSWGDPDEFYLTSPIEAYVLKSGKSEFVIPKDLSLIDSVVTQSGSIYFLSDQRDPSDSSVRKLWEEKIVLQEQEKFLKLEEMRQFFSQCTELNPYLTNILIQISREAKCELDYHSPDVKTPESILALNSVVPGIKRKPLDILVDILAAESKRVGILRLNIAQLISEFLTKRYKVLDTYLEKSGILGMFIFLFFTHEKCSVLHSYVSQMIITILNGVNKSFIQYLLLTCDFTFLLLDSPKKVEYRAHLIEIAFVIDKRSKELPFLASMLKSVTRWENFVKDDLEMILLIQEQPYKPPKKREMTPPKKREMTPPKKKKGKTNEQNDTSEKDY